MTDERRRRRPFSERLVASLLEANAVAALRSPMWWRSLPRKLALAALVVSGGLAATTWWLGGVTATAAHLLRKESATAIPGGASLRRLAVRVLATRALPTELLVTLMRQAHLLTLDDPLRPHIVAMIASATRTELAPTLPPEDVLARLDAAVARATGRALSGRGVIEWRPLDPYFVITLEELSGVSGVARAVEVYNGLQPPDGLPTSEWYLDELVNAFDDPRPLPFVLVTSSSGDDWGPLAMVPEEVPSYARRLPARTVGEALRIGLWGFDGYHPGDPTADPHTWWQTVARRQGLPAFDVP